MLKIGFYKNGELLIGGQRNDYEIVRHHISQLFIENGASKTIHVVSNGEVMITQIIIHKGLPPNMVFYKDGNIIFSIASELLEQFLSFITFPPDNELPNSPIRYHHHYESTGADDCYIAPSSLSVVFTLE